ncbi:unnamed protein product [Callosobruchus maculatus]|uniref:Uncharacterized protein n=1 Tax=Callosobruchus maculatus TaxID=64391 RepID=A0A653CHA9_CALMS|nr:unnamed protein product [Callosobruchus maculatus]
MIVGCAVNFWARHLLQTNRECHITPFNIKLSIVMYFSYFVLFARLFYKAYMAGDRKEKRKQPVTADCPLFKSKVQ